MVQVHLFTKLNQTGTEKNLSESDLWNDSMDVLVCCLEISEGQTDRLVAVKMTKKQGIQIRAIKRWFKELEVEIKVQKMSN